MSLRQIQQGLKSSDEVEVLRALQEITQNDVVIDEDASRSVFPHVITSLRHNDVRVRSAAMSVMAKQLRDQNQYMVYHVDEFGKAMASPEILDLKSGDGSGAFVSLHKELIYSIGELQKRFPGKVMPHFKALAQYLIACIVSKHLDMATAACEHWASLSIPAPVPPKYMDLWTHAVYPKLPKLIPNLMSAMKYQEQHVNYLETKTQSTGAQFRPQTASKELEQYVARRNYAAQGFENITNLFGVEVIGPFKMNLIKRTKTDNWLELEASFLALGAFTAALGTPKEMQDVYTEVIPKLLDSYNHPKALVRSITCFTMQHFVNTPKIKNVKNPFGKMMKSTLNLITDESMEVQEMALRSLATMLAYSESDMSAFGQKIIDSLIRANEHIFGDARHAYYECIGHVFGQFGAAMDQPSATNLIRPLLHAYESLPWKNMQSESVDDMIMLCQPILVTIMFTKDKFSTHNTAILDKAVTYINSVKDSPNAGGEPTTSHMVSVLDLISAIFDNQRQGTDGYLHQYDLDTCVLSILKNQTFEQTVHQSAMALMGHMYLVSPQRMMSHINDVIRIATRLMDSKIDTVQNNTLWALVNIAKNLEGKCEPLFSMINEITPFILDTKGDQGVIINAALLLTTLSTKWPEVFIRVLAKDEIFTHLFCLMQTDFPQDNAHVEIFVNLCDSYKDHVDKVKPELWVHFCVSAIQLPFDVPVLNTKIKKLLKDVRAHVGQSVWSKINSQMGKTMSTNLRKKFKLY